MMAVISRHDALHMIAEQRRQASEIAKARKLPSPEQGVAVGLKTATRILLNLPQANTIWKDAKLNPPKKDGMYFVTVNAPNGSRWTKLARLKDGAWAKDFDVTHWTYMPKPCEEGNDG